MKAYDLLSKPIRSYIYDQGWQALRPIQEAAIRMVMTTEANLILAAPTASGKTEAAFLPTMSLISDWSSSVKILAISPLIALINDQYQRLSGLCEHLDIPLTAWHGEASTSAKKKLRQQPAGIVVMTPESLEAMFIHRPEEVSVLFSELEWVFVDELHSFLHSSRGAQLQSLLYRLQRRTKNIPRYIGMSATLAQEDYIWAKGFFGQKDQTFVVLDKKDRPARIAVNLHEGPDKEEELLNAIYAQARHQNLLVFPNSRRKVEEIAHGLRKRARKEGRDLHIFAHHSSVEKDWREAAETFAKNPQGLFTICATSTLELGIDIGAVDAVIQVEAPASASSLAQRMGRSGRGEWVNPQTGKLEPQPSTLYLQATSDWALLQSLAASRLIQSGRLDASLPLHKPYDVWAHQLLSLVVEESGLAIKDLVNLPKESYFWSDLTQPELRQLVQYLVDQDILEGVQGRQEELIIGLAGEAIVNRYDFYALFQTRQEFSVYYENKQIGSLPLSPNIQVGARILLSGQVWEILSIEYKTKKIRLDRAEEGKAPSFSGEAVPSSGLLRQEMLALIHDPPRGLSQEIDRALERLALQFPSQSLLQWVDTSLLEDSFVLFTGTAVERAVYLLLLSRFPYEDARIYWNMGQARLHGRDLAEGWARLRESWSDPQAVWMELESFLQDSDELRQKLLADVKFKDLLPASLQTAYILHNLLDVSATQVLLDSYLY